jgi:hypothetical protein
VAHIFTGKAKGPAGKPAVYKLALFWAIVMTFNSSKHVISVDMEQWRAEHSALIAKMILLP